jgi:hypothetical protein
MTRVSLDAGRAPSYLARVMSLGTRKRLFATGTCTQTCMRPALWAEVPPA